MRRALAWLALFLCASNLFGATWYASNLSAVGASATLNSNGLTTAPSYSTGFTNCSNGSGQTITFTNGGGAGATATTTIAGTSPNQTLSSITITLAGSGYTSAPTSGTISGCTGTGTFTGGAIGNALWCSTQPANAAALCTGSLLTYSAIGKNDILEANGATAIQINQEPSPNVVTLSGTYTWTYGSPTVVGVSGTNVAQVAANDWIYPGNGNGSIPAQVASVDATHQTITLAAPKTGYGAAWYPGPNCTACTSYDGVVTGQTTNGGRFNYATATNLVSSPFHFHCFAITTYCLGVTGSTNGGTQIGLNLGGSSASAYGLSDTHSAVLFTVIGGCYGGAGSTTHGCLEGLGAGGTAHLYGPGWGGTGSSANGFYATIRTEYVNGPVIGSDTYNGGYGVDGNGATSVTVVGDIVDGAQVVGLTTNNSSVLWQPASTNYFEGPNSGSYSVANCYPYALALANSTCGANNSYATMTVPACAQGGSNCLQPNAIKNGTAAGPLTGTASGGSPVIIGQ